MEQPYLIALEAKHAELDKRISVETQRPRPDEYLVSDLKKQKLKIKEELQFH